MLLYHGARFLMPLTSSIIIFIEYKLFLTVNYSLRVRLMSRVTLKQSKTTVFLAESPDQKSWGSTRVLQLPRPNSPLLSQEGVSIIKREEDVQSFPVGHMQVTLNKRAARSPGHHVSFTQLHGSQPAPLLTSLLRQPWLCVAAPLALLQNVSPLLHSCLVLFWSHC